jgi:hypothetical protein
MTQDGVCKQQAAKVGCTYESDSVIALCWPDLKCDCNNCFTRTKVFWPHYDGRPAEELDIPP